MKNILSMFICFNLLLCSGLQAKTYHEGCCIACQNEYAYKNGLDVSYNEIINILNEKINNPLDIIESDMQFPNEYVFSKINFYLDCIKMIESKYPIQKEKRENALKFIETTRIW